MAGYIDNSTDLALFGSYSQGRALAGARLANLSRFAQWSALLDGKTCDWCGWADMRVFDTTIEPYDPPMHHGCRCLVAYITNDEFAPTPDWRQGPPKSSWPPGTTGGCTPLSIQLAVGVATGCAPTMRSKGMATKPKPNQTAINSAADSWQSDLGQKFGQTQDRAKIPAGEIRKWQRKSLKNAGASASDIKSYDSFMNVFTGGYPVEIVDAYGAAANGSVDGFKAAVKRYVARLEGQQARGITVGDLEPFRRMIDNAEDMVKVFKAQADISSEIMRRGVLINSDNTVTVYRGLKSTQSGDYVAKLRASLVGDTEQAIGTRSIESWTTDKAVAQKFAGADFKGIDGIVLTKKVPVDDVFNFWQTEGGFARHKESEILWSNGSQQLVPKAVTKVGKTMEVEIW